MIAMLGWFSEARTCASRSNRAIRSASAANASGRILMATSRSQARVARPIHFAHAAGPEGGEYLVRADTDADGKWHMREWQRAMECEVFGTWHEHRCPIQHRLGDRTSYV